MAIQYIWPRNIYINIYKIIFQMKMNNKNKNKLQMVYQNKNKQNLII